jgi:cytochrome c-type biogenesis protein CcmH/NrfG
MGPTKPATLTENGAPALELASIEFLPDEDVLDDVADASPEGQASNVIFAGPSEAPPAHAVEAIEARARIEAGTDLRISQIERRDSIRYFVVLVAVLAAIVASVFVRPRDTVRDALDVSTAQTARPVVVGADSMGAASRPDPMGSEAAKARAMSNEEGSEALEAKRASQTALEEGKSAQAIEAGERAVTLDPTDAEAWLILGAGYDQRGTHADARRCFVNCVRLATHGPRGECAALLR